MVIFKKLNNFIKGTNSGIDVCYHKNEGKFDCKLLTDHSKSYKTFGQMVFADLELTGELNMLLPACTDTSCKILLFANNTWKDTKVDFTFNGIEWHFLTHHMNRPLFSTTYYLRSGDYNMDGYPDYLVNLINDKNETRTYLLENLPCSTDCLMNTRQLRIQWSEFSYLTNVVCASFFDSAQNGNLDIFAVDETSSNLQTKIYKHTTNEDRNFLKVAVLTGKANFSLVSNITVSKKLKHYGSYFDYFDNDNNNVLVI